MFKSLRVRPKGEYQEDKFPVLSPEKVKTRTDIQLFQKSN